jgi:hypothetical protein
MYRYSAKIRIGGSVLNEVRKTNMSAAEVILLRRLHGADALAELKETGSDKAPHAEERQRLVKIYCNGESERRTKINFEQIFGPEHLELPNRLPEFIKGNVATPEIKALPPEVDVPEDEVSLEDLAG